MPDQDIVDAVRDVLLHTGGSEHYPCIGCGKFRLHATRGRIGTWKCPTCLITNTIPTNNKGENKP